MVLLLSACKAIHLATIKVDPTIEQSTTAVPVQLKMHFSNRSFKFAEFEGEAFKGRKNETYEKFSVINEGSAEASDTFKLASQSGEKWRGVCHFSSQWKGVQSIQFSWGSSSKCEYFEDGGTNSIGVLEFTEYPEDLPGSTVLAKYSNKSGLSIEFHSIHQSADGPMFTTPIGFDIWMNNKNVGAISCAGTSEPKIWMPKSITPAQRLAIALSLWPLITYESADNRLAH